ncbi:MAG: family 78 glycoside hydrolase catalytic domain [Bacteroides sp.]|nr:family 78 glycoside hydrolase catalytic domain [Bacteroides sp.]
MLAQHISEPSVLLDNTEPVANWIWDSGADNPLNYYLLVRKTVDLEQVPSKAEAFISAFAFAHVYINGKLVDRVPMNCDPEFQVYEKFNLSSYFREGENTISALVYNYGVGMHHRINGRGGFFFQGELEFGNHKTILVNSDDSWKVSPARAWDSQSEMRAPGAHLIGFVERYDARLMPDQWKESSFDDSGWQAANELGLPPLAPWNNIVEVERPPLHREVVYPVDHWYVGDKVVYDFGTELSGSPLLELFSREEGVLLEMGTAECLYPDSSARYTERIDYSDYYTSKKGTQSWGPVTWRGFRYLSLSREDELIIKNVSAIKQHYDLKREGSFECSDPLLNKIWEVGNQTLLLCSQDTYMDTPWREQTQYIAGDSRYLQKYAFYGFGLSSELLTCYNILSGAWSQRWSEDGSIRSRYPTDWLLGENTSTYLADYELEWILMLGEYYRYFGKKDLVLQVYPNMKKLMTLFEGYLGDEHGLLFNVPGWIVLDHPDTYPMDQREEICALNCLYYGALLQASDLAEHVADDPDNAALWEAQAKKLGKNIQKHLWSTEKQLYMDSYGSDKFSKQTQVYALLYGLVDAPDRERVIETIADENLYSEQSFSYYVAASVFKERPQWALDFIRENWERQMLTPHFNGAWHEAWDIASFGDDLLSTSHAWSGGPTALLPEKVLGVESTSAGWKTFTVRPNLADLKWAKGMVPTPFGPIYVECNDASEEDFNLYLLVPEHTHAEIAVPGNDPGKIKVNNLPLEKSPGIEEIGSEKGSILLNAQPGEYQIIVTSN